MTVEELCVLVSIWKQLWEHERHSISLSIQILKYRSESWGAQAFRPQQVPTVSLRCLHKLLWMPLHSKLRQDCSPWVQQAQRVCFHDFLSSAIYQQVIFKARDFINQSINQFINKFTAYEHLPKLLSLLSGEQEVCCLMEDRLMSEEGSIWLWYRNFHLHQLNVDHLILTVHVSLGNSCV